MDITSAKYVKGRDGNKSAINYAEINRQVGEGSLTIAEAD